MIEKLVTLLMKLGLERLIIQCEPCAFTLMDGYAQVLVLNWFMTYSTYCVIHFINNDAFQTFLLHYFIVFPVNYTS